MTYCIPSDIPVSAPLVTRFLTPKLWRFHNPRLLALLVLAAGLAITTLLWRSSEQFKRNEMQERFNFSVRDAGARIEQQMAVYEQLLQSAGGFMSHADVISRDEFRQFVAKLRLDENLPGIQAVAFARIVPAAHKERQSVAIRNEGYPDYAIHPGGERESYAPIIYIEPFSGRNLRAFGQDTYSQPVYRAAMDLARDLDQPVISGKLTLVQEEDDQHPQAGFIMYLPVYKVGAQHRSIAERRASIIGWISAPFRMDDLMDSLHGEQAARLDIEIFDGDEMSAKTLMYDPDHDRIDGKPVPGLFQTIQRFRIANHTWTMEIRSRPAFDAQLDRVTPRIVALSGASISLLLALLTLVLASGRERALQTARAMNRELIERETRYRQMFEDNTSIAYLLEPDSGRIVDANAAAAAFWGYSLEQLRSMTIADINAAPSERNEKALHHLMNGQKNQLEWRHRLKNGEIRDVEVFSSPLAYQGKVFLYSILHDISARKRAEQTLHDSEADLRVAATAFEAQVGMIVTDTNSVILKVNRAFLDNSGYTTEEVVGQTPRLFKSGRHDTSFYAAMWESIRRTGAWQGEIWDRHKNGEIFPKWLTITAVVKEDGVVTHYVGAHTDITERKAAEDEIRNLAFYDSLTHLPNRRLLRDRLHQALASSTRRHRQGALFFIDLDNFKTLNDTLGHDRGDLLLQQVAQRLLICVREGDSVARLGGDEFVVLLEDLSPRIAEAQVQVEMIGKKILAALNVPYFLSGHEYLSTASIGVTLFGKQHEASDELLKQADLAMYQAKAAGRNALRFFDPAMQDTVTARVTLEKELRTAVQEGQFVLHYQAQVDGGGNLTGAEVLVRWQHPQRGLVFPDAFIALAEETGLIVPLGHWVLESACFQLAAWANQPNAADLTLAVNVSVQQLRQSDFVKHVLAVLARTGAAPRKLKLELTESLLMDSVEDTIAKMAALKAQGVGFALDDFGTGYSSLTYLKRLPLEKLKIDRSFVMDVLTDPNDAAIAKTIVALAHSLGLAVIAEGVETEEQRDFLASNGCHAYQGYLFSRPLALDNFEQFLNRNETQTTACS